MKRKLSWSIFWATVAVFIIIIAVILIPPARELLMGSFFLFTSGTILILLGAALIFRTVKEKVGGLLGKFLIVTGASAVGLFVSILLHNAVYGLFIFWFGADFWDRIGMADEPVFFFIALLVCPVAFLVGTVGSIVLAVKRHERPALLRQ